MSRKISKPNYTQIPNDLFEMLPLMKEAEMRVVMAVARATFGYHRDEVGMSLTDLQEATGMSRQGVLNGIEYALTRETIERIPDGDSYRYALAIADDEEPQGSQRSVPEVVNEVDPLIYKEDLKKEKERPAPATEGLTVANFDRVVGAYERNIGPMMPALTTAFDEALKRYSVDWLVEAIEITQARFMEGKVRRPSWAYALGIVESWAESGYDGGVETVDIERVMSTLNIRNMDV